MFHRHYSHASRSPEPGVAAGPATPEPAFVHQVRVAEPAPAQHEKLRQRQEEVIIQQQLLETEQELDGIKAEEKALVRRREELQTLNERQTAFHDGRHALGDRIQKALMDFERASWQSQKDVRELEEALGTCRRYQDELERLAPAAIPALRSDAAFRRQLEFLADFERRLEAELIGADEPETEAGAGANSKRWLDSGFGECFLRGLRLFWPYLGAGAVGLWILLSLTGGGR